MSDLEKDFLKQKLGKLPLKPASLPADDDLEELDDDVSDLNDFRFTPGSTRKYGDLTPLSADTFFQDALEIHPAHSDTTFRCYFTPAKPKEDSEAIYFVLHHGLGYSALSFAQCAKELGTLAHDECGFISLDCRGHGKTKGENEYNLTLEQMSDDLVAVLKEILPRRDKVKLVLVGHSMGGPVVVAAAPKVQQQVAPLLGIAILDIVEGTARDALHNMHAFLQKLPPQFDNIQQAISWFLSSNTVHNPQSLRVSAPPLFLTNPTTSKLLWRTDMSQTQQYWNSWFENLSKSFLAVKAAKLLVLAGTDRLDTELTIGQMQGKYQLTVIPEAGHCLHEDTPKRLASILHEFWRRNDSTDILKNVKKVGQGG